MSIKYIQQKLASSQTTICRCILLVLKLLSLRVRHGTRMLGDFVQVIHKVNNVMEDFSDVGNLIKEVKDLKKNMAYAEFGFIRI